jgi:arylsulfatase
VHNLAGTELHRITSTRVVPPGAHELAFAFAAGTDFSGHGRLLIDGEVVGEGSIPRFTPARFSITGGGLTCGYELGPAVATDYKAPFRFNATLHRVTVDVSGDAFRDAESEFDAIMSEQ